MLSVSTNVKVRHELEYNSKFIRTANNETVTAYP